MVAAAVLLLPVPGSAQGGHEGWAVVTVDRAEYTIVIECADAARPELGFRTQLNRVTRAATGRSNGVGLSLRPWEETDDVAIWLDKYVAWVPRPASAGGELVLEVDMSPMSVVTDGVPGLLTYDMWQRGERAEGRRARIRARCGERNGEAPGYRVLPDPG
jgi:hypothetical protein